MRNARFTVFCPFNIPQRYEIYAIYTLLTLKENTLWICSKIIWRFYLVCGSPGFKLRYFFSPKKRRDWWFQFADAFRGWSGTNFSEGVMVKSYLGFGMTHIREEATAQGVWMQNPARKTLGKFMQVHQDSRIPRFFGGFSSIRNHQIMAKLGPQRCGKSPKMARMRVAT